MATTGLQVWSAPEDFESFLSAGGSGFIFKHSTRCSISSEAYRQVESFASDAPEARIHVVLVVENRTTSNAVAEKLGVPHASPQAILVQDGRAAWHTSHWDITRKSLAEAWRSIEAS
jgi:bacillithiol system protein YtxJ